MSDFSPDDGARDPVPGAPVRRTAGVTFASSLGFDSVSHSYHGKETIRDISLEAQPGEVLCLLGPSGSGKTTLLRIAAGIEAQTAGRVLIDGRTVAGPDLFVAPEKRGIGLMFQDYALFPHLSVLDNARFGLTALPSSQARSEAMVALERVGLSHYAQKFPHALSGGEQQRVALARALAPRPGVLLMDEPFSGLDSRLKDAVRADTLDVLRQSRATAIVVTHDAEEAMRMGDRIALLNHGRLVQVGRAQELYRRPQSLFSAAFFSEINRLEGRVRDGVVATPLGIRQAPGLAEGAAVDVAVRISQISVAAEGGMLSARILTRRFLGVVELLTLAVDGLDEPLRARIRADQLPDGLVDVSVNVAPDDILLFEKQA
jgi:iron(III) transport system ATP-binding protein